MTNQTSFLNFSKEKIEDFANQRWIIIDDFFPISVTELLYQEAVELDEENLYRPAQIGQRDKKTTVSEIRSDRIFWLDPDHLTLSQSFYLEEMMKLKEVLNREFFLGVKDFEAMGAIYPKDSFYLRHKDQFSKDDARKISCVLYVNPFWDSSWGGELVLYPEGKDLVKVAPKPNRLVLFQSQIEHEVLKTKALRYSYTGWFKT